MRITVSLSYDVKDIRKQGVFFINTEENNQRKQQTPTTHNPDGAL